MPASRTTRSRLRTVFALVAAATTLASTGFALVVTVSVFASLGGLVVLTVFGIVVTLWTGSRLGLLGGGFEIGCKMFFWTVVSLVAWVAAQGLWPGLPMWPLVLTGVLIIPVSLLYFVLPRALKWLAESLRIQWAILVDRIRNP